MTQTGLIIALAIGAAGGLVLGLFPQLDIAISALAYDPAQKDFVLRLHPALIFVRDASMWVVGALVAPAFLAIAVKLILPRRPMLIPGRAVVFLIVSIALGPIVVANGLKDHWPRSRPIDIPQFNGDERFSPWWDPRGGCDKNCSFVAGEGAGAFWTIAPAALTPPPWRPLAYAAAIGFGAAISGLRLVFGGHFASDLLFAGVFVFLVIWLVYAAIYRWPRTRFSDEAVERAIERLVLPIHDFVRGLFVRRRA